MSFNDRVYEIVRQIPEGKVLSYGQVACMAGSWRASRAVGYALHRNPYQGKVPCHRVVFQDGRLVKALYLVAQVCSVSCWRRRVYDLQTKVVWIWASAAGTLKNEWL